MSQIEALVINCLNSELDVPAYAEVPEDPPDSYVVIEKTGGNTTNHIRYAEIAVDSYAPSLYEASVLDEEVSDAMDMLTFENEVSGVEFVSSHNHTNKTTKQPRYQSLFEITYY